MHRTLHLFSRRWSLHAWVPVLLLAIGALCQEQARAQATVNPVGFEDGVVSSWVTGSASETISLSAAPANVRTGSNALQFTTTSTSSNKYAYTNTPYAAASSGNYVHFIYWAKGTDAATSVDASMRYGSSAPPSGAGSTANASSQATLTSTGWTRLSYVAGNSTRWYFPSPRRTSGNATTFYMDDMILYSANTNVTDLTDPLIPSSLTAAAAGSVVNLGWTSATDAGTGVQATIVLRTTNAAAATPDLNDQAVYSVTGGADGPNVAGDWTVISTTTGATATAYADAAVPNGTYKYAVVLRDLAYNYSAAAVSGTVTVGSSATPVITLNQTGFIGNFGNVVSGIASAAQLYTASGANLTANLVITAPAGFEVSQSPGTGFGNTVTLTPAAGTVAPTNIYVRYAPVAATGASGSMNIVNASAGAASQNVTVSGNALATEPTAAGTITFGTAATTSMVVNLPTTGNGSKRIIVARQGSAVTFTPADGTAPGGVNASFSSATDQGSGNKILYDGAGSGSSVVTATGLTAGSTYYFAVYEYNEGTGTSRNYLLTPAATGSNSTAGLPAPSVVVTQTGFNGAFGNVVAGTASAAQQYSVSGTNLTADISISAPAGFQISTAAATGFAGTLTLAQSAGTVAPTAIYARFAPAAATGSTGSLSITHTSTGAVPQNVGLSGNAIATEPTAAGTIAFGAVSNNSIVVDLPLAGNGSKRILVIRAGSAVSFTPADGTAPSGVSAAFGTATDQGSGNRIVYDGNGSGAGVVTVTGLSGGVTYHFAVYEYNEGTGTSRNYLGAPAATGNATTTVPTPVITLSPGTFTGNFGNVVTATTSANQQYSISGVNLTAGITLTAPAGFQLSTSSSSGFTPSLTLAPTGGSVAATTIYVRYAPAAATGNTGAQTISHASAGAATQTIGVSGNALAAEPTTAGTITFGTIGAGSIVVNLPTTGNGSRRLIVARQAAATTFTPADGLGITGVSNDFSLATDQGGGNKVIYDGAGAGSSVVTVTGLSTGTQYYFTVFEYNMGSGTSQNYRLSPAATGNATTIIPVPTLVIDQTGFTAGFGKVAMGSTSAVQQYSVSGSALSSDITITAPAGFEVSLSAGSGFAATVTIARGTGTVAGTPVFVRFAPTGATGSTGNLTITHTSSPAVSQSVTVSGIALATEPTLNGTITFGNVTDTTIEVHLPTVGNGSRRMIVANLGSPAPFVPADAVAVTGVHSNYQLAADQGAGERIIYDGTGSGSRVVTLTGLTPGMLYYFTVYEYNEGTGNSQNYFTASAAFNNMTTSQPNLGAASLSSRGIRIYPNPVADYLIISTRERITAQLSDAVGRVLLQSDGTGRLATGHLPAGSYLLTVRNGQGQAIRTERIIKTTN